MSTSEIVVVGAGMAGLATAYHLAVRHRLPGVVLVDEREPLTLTSDKGTQAYRNWWPGPDDTMLRYMSRSLDLLEEMAEESGNAFRLNRRGYVFLTADNEGVDRLRATARAVSAFGMGPLREHDRLSEYSAAPPEGYHDQPIGADLLLGEAARRAFPGVTADVKAALHVRRAGWMNAVALGGWLLKQALGSGATFIRDRVDGFDLEGGRVRGVRLASGRRLATERVVIAAGPGLPRLTQLLDVHLPLFHELHAKVTLRDPLGIVDRRWPFLIWTDPMSLPWSAEERRLLERDASKRRLLEPFPGGVHVRPVDGPFGDELFLIWTYDVEEREFTWPPHFDPSYADATIRGSARLLPGMSKYAGRTDGLVDGGYYCKTRENRPLAGPLPVSGAYVVGALSGFGIMGAHAGADLVAAHVTGSALPAHARWFLPSRYEDATYRAEIAGWGALVGQL